jgi:hypothetical protein
LLIHDRKKEDEEEGKEENVDDDEFLKIIIPGCCGPRSCTSINALQSKRVCLNSEINKTTKITSCWWLTNTPGCCGNGNSKCITEDAQISKSKCSSYELNKTSGDSNCIWVPRNEHWLPPEVPLNAHIQQFGNYLWDEWMVPFVIAIAHSYKNDYRKGLLYIVASTIIGTCILIYECYCQKNKNDTSGRTSVSMTPSPKRRNSTSNSRALVKQKQKRIDTRCCSICFCQVTTLLIIFVLVMSYRFFKTNVIKSLSYFIPQ